jgi:arsenate reductase
MAAARSTAFMRAATGTRYESKRSAERRGRPKDARDDNFTQALYAHKPNYTITNRQRPFSVPTRPDRPIRPRRTSTQLPAHAKIPHKKTPCTPTQATLTQPTMITIYHNPRCSKSRATCDLIAATSNSANEPTEIVEYLKQPLTVAQLQQLNAQLGCTVREMIRDTEAEYKALGLSDTTLSDAQLYEALAKHPILLQRPIVVRNGRAVIGRPPENVEVLFA